MRKFSFFKIINVTASWRFSSFKVTQTILTSSAQSLIVDADHRLPVCRYDIVIVSWNLCMYIVFKISLLFYSPQLSYFHKLSTVGFLQHKHNNSHYEHRPTRILYSSAAICPSYWSPSLKYNKMGAFCRSIPQGEKMNTKYLQSNIYTSTYLKWGYKLLFWQFWCSERIPRYGFFCKIEISKPWDYRKVMKESNPRE